MSLTIPCAVLRPTPTRASFALRARAVPALRFSAFSRRSLRTSSRRSRIEARTSKYEDVEEITPMMLTTAALGALGSAFSVFLLASTVEATSVVAMTAASLAEAEEIALTMEYSSRVPAARLAAAPAVELTAVDAEKEYAQSGQDFFECDIQSLRCVT
jgi:hypothetical protein